MSDVLRVGDHVEFRSVSSFAGPTPCIIRKATLSGLFEVESVETGALFVAHRRELSAASSSSTPLSETPSDIAPTFSGRGFARWPMVTDNRGVTVEVAESSAASGPHIWVFTQGGEESYKKPMDGSAHLTLEQATALRDTLTSAIRFMSTRFAPASLAPLSEPTGEGTCENDREWLARKLAHADDSNVGADWLHSVNLSVHRVYVPGTGFYELEDGHIVITFDSDGARIVQKSPQWEHADAWVQSAKQYRAMAARDSAVVALFGHCSRCLNPIKDFSPPVGGMTAGYYVAAAWPKYANRGEVYICDACMRADPRYVADYGAAPLSEPTSEGRNG